MGLGSILGIKAAWKNNFPRDKPKNSYGGSAYSFFSGRSTSGNPVNEMRLPLFLGFRSMNGVIFHSLHK